jgi:hypothetical protein
MTMKSIARAARVRDIALAAASSFSARRSVRAREGRRPPCGCAFALIVGFGCRVEVAEHRDIRVRVLLQHLLDELLDLQRLELALMIERAGLEVHDEHRELVSVLRLEVDLERRTLELLGHLAVGPRPCAAEALASASVRRDSMSLMTRSSPAKTCARLDRDARQHRLLDAAVVRDVLARDVVVAHVLQVGRHGTIPAALRLDLLEAEDVCVELADRLRDGLEPRFCSSPP